MKTICHLHKKFQRKNSANFQRKNATKFRTPKCDYSTVK